MNISDHIWNDNYKHCLFNLASIMKAKRILETGVREGYSTHSFLELVRITSGHVTSIDYSDKCEFMGRCPEDLKPYWTTIIKDAREGLKDLNKDRQIFDIIFLDDCHDYLHVKEEVELCENLMTYDSLLLIHDAMYYDYEPRYRKNQDYGKYGFADGGVYRVLQELDRTRWEFVTIPVPHGVSVLRKILV